jgi:SAM-dependent methyltransferase
MITGPAQLCKFLDYCNESPLSKVILDCGAGGQSPPLAFFHEHGYTTYGVEISERQMELARNFCKQHALELNVLLGDMRRLPFADESMSFAYSYNSICHMTKDEVGISMLEIERVLRPGGLCYVNFLSIEDGRFGKGKRHGEGEYVAEINGEMALHCFFKDDEPDRFFTHFGLLRKEKIRIENYGSGGTHVCADLCYFARKH